MQNIVHKLQDMIQTYYGFTSQFDWQNSLEDTEPASTTTGILSVPLFEPKSKRPLAYFKVLDVPPHQPDVQNKLRELIQFSLQNYINLMDKLDVADNFLQYLQMELNPQKIIRLQGAKQSLKQPADKHLDQKFNLNSSSIAHSTISFDHKKQALLLKSDSPVRLERLALSLHATAQNHYFLRTDQMGDSFLTTMNDLAGLNKTTLYIPNIESLSERQQKTLETFWLMTKPTLFADVLVVAATQSTLSELVKPTILKSSFLRNFDFFYLLSDSSSEAEIRFENLNQCAHAILQAAPEHHLKHHKFSQNIRSCHLIPSCESLFPSVH